MIISVDDLIMKRHNTLIENGFFPYLFEFQYFHNSFDHTAIQWLININKQRKINLFWRTKRRWRNKLLRLFLRNSFQMLSQYYINNCDTHLHSFCIINIGIYKFLSLKFLKRQVYTSSPSDLYHLPYL